MIYVAHIHEEGTPDNYFNSEVEADSFDLAIESATRQLLEAFLSEPSKEPGGPESLIIVLSERDFNTPPQAWKLSLKTKIAVPCPECLGVGGVDSGGVDPQGKGIDIPCPSCQETHEHTNFSQTVCAVCSTAHPLEKLIGTCPQCREAKTVLDAWQEAFGTNQLTHALAENQAYGKALTNFQNEVWASLNKYSAKLGWGLSGMQPECWALLDSAVEELVKQRIQVEKLRTLKRYSMANTATSHACMREDPAGDWVMWSEASV